MKIPEPDSIRELAEFWDTHDVTEFDDQLDEVARPVFVPSAVTVPLSAEERRALREVASSRGIDEAVLVQEWVREKLHH